MNPLAWFGLALLAVVAVAVVVRAITRRGRWAVDIPLAVAAACAIGVVVGGRADRPTETVVILDQPLTPARRNEFARLLDKLRATGTERVAVIEISPGEPVEPHWQSPTAEPRPGRRATLHEAVQAGIAFGVARGHWDTGVGIVRRSAVRVVVTVSDPERWKELDPIGIDSTLALARRTETVLDVVDLTRHPVAATVEVSFPFPLPADKPLDKAGVLADVTVRAPPLVPRQGQTIHLQVDGILNGDAAAVERFAVSAVVSADGAVRFKLPLRNFRHPTTPAQPVVFSAGFALCELTVTEPSPGGVMAKGAAYLPVKAATVAIVCGTGSGPDRLRPTTATNPVKDLHDTATPLTSDRASPLANLLWQFEADFLALLDTDKGLPQVAVLHELPPTFWTKKTVEKLTAAVAGGMHLMVIDPPVKPAAGPPPMNDGDPASAAQLAALLPGFSTPDSRGAAVAPRQTTDRTPVLNLVFDYGRFGRIAGLPGEDGAALSGAMAFQKTAADALLAELKDEGGQPLVTGKLVETGGGLVYETATPEQDRVRVRVAPRLSADDEFADTLLPSAIDLRVGSLFDKVPTFGFARTDTGLTGAPSSGADPLDDPHHTPNQAVVVFAGYIHQPLPDPARPALVQKPIRYRLGAESSANRLFTKNADGATANVLIRGGVVSVVQLTLPAFHAGFESLTNVQPGVATNELAGFRQPMPFFLDTQLPKDVKALADSGKFLLTADEAKARLRQHTFDLTQPTRAADAKAIVAKLADETRDLFRSPRTGMAVAVASPDRWVDERVGPVAPESELRRWQTTPGELDSRWPAAARTAAPRRFRTLTTNTAMPVTDLLFAVDVGTGGPRLAPRRLASATVVGNGSVAVFGYSPFDTAPGWRLPNSVHEKGATVADSFGAQRVLDAAYFLTRLQPLPTAAPRLREVSRSDARGELELVADFLPAHAERDEFWRPRLTWLTPNGPVSEPLDVAAVSVTSGEVRYRATPPAMAPLFTKNTPDTIPVRPLFGGTDPTHQLVVRRPSAGRWSGVTAYHSVAVAASYSGGGTMPLDSLGPVGGSVRVWWLLGLTAALLVAAVVRGWWRWRRLFPRRTVQPPEAKYPMVRLDVSALVEQVGATAGIPRSGRRNASVDHTARITGRDKLKALRREIIIRLGLGIAADPKVERRVHPKCAQVDIAVHLGRSMRVTGSGGLMPKVRLAAVAVQMVAEIAWSLAGTRVRCLAFGLRGGTRIWGPAPARDRENGFMEEIAAWVADTPPADAEPLAVADCEPGTLLVWVSDFLTEEPAELLAAGAAVTEDAGQFAAVAVRTPEDAEQVGVGLVAPLVVLDRAGLTPAELLAAIDDRLALARRQFEQDDRPFAVLEATMSGEEMIEALGEAGVPGRVL